MVDSTGMLRHARRATASLMTGVEIALPNGRMVSGDRVSVHDTISRTRRFTRDVSMDTADFFDWFVLEYGRLVQLWSRTPILARDGPDVRVP